MVKVYVIAWNYAYEGYGRPQSAFATLEAAEEAIKGQGDSYDSPEIFELEVEGMPEPVYEYGYKALGESIVPATESHARAMHERWGDKLMRRGLADWEEVE